MASPTVSGIWWQSANQNLHGGHDDEEQNEQAGLKMKAFVHLAETLVVKETQSLMKVRGVVPVMSSH